MLKKRLVAEDAQCFAVGVKSVKPDDEEAVYNMEVEDNHNFSVNGGLIVHNCDACRYFTKTMRIAKHQTEYRSVWNKYTY